MTKSRLKILEKIFDREINDTLPFQSGSVLCRRLHSEGMISPMDKTFGSRERFPVKVKGWQLTELGRFTFCQSTTDEAREEMKR